MVSILAPPPAVLRFRPVLGSLALAVLWAVLAWRSPTSTHHFAPFVVAAAWGFLTDTEGPVAAWWAASAGFVVAATTVLVLGLSDRLDGPTLWGARPSWPELLGFAAIGSAVTLVRARRTGSRP